MKIKYKVYKNGIKVYELGDKYITTYNEDVWGIGNNEHESMAYASREFRDSKDLLLEPTPFDNYEDKGTILETDIEPLIDYKDIAVFVFPPYYFVYDKEKGKVISYDMDLEDALNNAMREKPHLLELLW